jgi:hypothetical protein
MRENREPPAAPTKGARGGPVGEGHEPQDQRERYWGVGWMGSTDEESEQRDERANHGSPGGGLGGKPSNQEEHRRGLHVPDAEPEKCVSGTWRCTGGSFDRQHSR